MDSIPTERTKPAVDVSEMANNLTDEKDTWSVYTKTRSTVNEYTDPLSTEELDLLTRYFHASMYLCLGMLYLKENPLLQEPLKKEHIKPRLLGHWGSDAGQSFTYIHFNRMVKKYDLNAFVISGPGHGAPGLISNFYLEGTYSEVYPNKSEDIEGLQRFFKQFSFPGGIGSHMTPETPGSIHEGGELGYSLSHAFGAVFDHPQTIALTIVGDGESETGPLATSWHSNKFLNPITDGAVLPVLHLNGYKINNPTVLARISHEELRSLMVGYGWTPYFVVRMARAATRLLFANERCRCCIGRPRSREYASGHGRNSREVRQGDPRIPKRSSRFREIIQAQMAHDHPPISERLDRPSRDRGTLPRRFLESASSASTKSSHRSRTDEGPRALDARLRSG